MSLVWILDNKFLAFMIIATTAFGISTIVLAVQKAELQIDFNSCKDHTTTSQKPTETTSVTASTSTGNPSSTGTTGTTITGNPSSTTTGTTLTTGSTIVSSTLPTTPATTPPQDMSEYRLPEHVIPISYDLTIEPNLDTGLFTGKVKINVKVDEETKEVKLHSHKLNIVKVMIDEKSAEKKLLDKYQLLVISLENDQVLQKGDHNIYIEYSGDMTDGIVGLYKSTYLDKNEKKRDIATSKFEPTYARQAFPCFDEPGFKATYTVHILKPKDDESYIALSNMPEAGSKTVENGILVTFEKSVKMSTYLACFIVCDFKSDNRTVITKQSGDINLKVYATPAQLSKTKFAGDIAEGVLKYFVEYFNYEYPLPKLDLIAIPDFVSGAMEHWGLVTFRETALLYDKDISSTINKQRVASVVSHELAHSWFGNLVTMSWWNDLWLNEGFASYIQYKGVDAVHKDWQMMDQFLIETLHPVLSIDALSSSHPIIKTVTTPDEITEIFDSITYNKGASILRMLEQAVTEETFKKAVQEYLKKHAFENAITQNLLDQLQPLVKDLNVTAFVDTWTKQVGYPILTVTEDKKKKYYSLTQKRFLKNPEEKFEHIDSADDYSWMIPVTYISSDSNKPELLWLNNNKDTLTFKKPKYANWIKFNPGQVGYYRVNYPIDDWINLANNIKKLSVSDKTHLLEESFSIAESGELSYEIPLDMTKYLAAEEEYIPWSVASSKLTQLKKYLDFSHYFHYLDYIIKIATPIYEKVTWNEEESEEHLTKRKRITILELLCSIEHEDCLKEASDRLDEWMLNSKTENVTQDLRSIVYKYGMVTANRQKWENMLGKFKHEVDANEKINMMRGLAAVKNAELLKYLIKLGETEEVIRGQDYFSMLQYVSDNSVGTSIVWDYVRENWENLVDRFTLNDRNLGKLIPAITSSFTTSLRLEEMHDFFDKYPDAGAGKAARCQALETVQANIEWTIGNRDKVQQWIDKNRVK